MSVLTLDLRPGAGIGAFSLGMPVCEALAYIEQHHSVFDVVHIKFNDEDPLQFDLVISFPEHGFHLRFEPRTQRLRLIEVYDVQRLQMRYATSSIGGPSVAATFVAVYALFGPTFPGSFDAKRNIYTLFYPGLAFTFPIPGQYTNCCQDREAELPIEFPDGTTPVMSRVCIYDGALGGNVEAGANLAALIKKAIPPQLPSGSLYMEEVHAKLAEDLFFTTSKKRLPFGASPQDVWAELGRPDGIHQKQVDPMVIHSASDPRPNSALCGDYFYNYFARGLDILFDGQTHRIKKFVLHTNFPAHTDFNSYIKCNFVIHCPLTGSDEKDSHYVITGDTKWPQIQQLLGDAGRAAIQTQGSVSNPFGPTFVYGYRNIAFEVMKNGHIATVTLFQTN
ncbi:hypothetical protein SELMODRAFT_231702 [Selaginella moellendorffii]|uniref:Uncharacterized protein n=2 Tax=Selaginella moellendorffii TaxID=88036 RepID=D8RIG5_SELML|nr:UPF0183 protein At3g51130 isoform X1 [Selaginella moellendorffii]EFJ28090.1 hypothetical protein SELMODRAFT_231702 [Selaginella moellendorffii]|eukprot:XP_002970764.1 UPF0183 protein At3g51130 isoform X1 [Selaginella moellendorffii]